MPYKDIEQRRENSRQKYNKNPLERLRERKARRIRYKQEGRCTECGILLIEGEGKRCVNCVISAHDGFIRGVVTYETAD